VKVLHLVSNHKLTGPVDPAIRLARALADLGVGSDVAVGRPGPGKGPIDDLVRERGLEPVTDLRLPKHRSLLANRGDRRRLVGLLEKQPVDILHAHLDNAHGTAEKVSRTIATRRGRDAAPRVVRTLYDDKVPPKTGRYRRLFSARTDGVFVFSAHIQEGLIDRFGLSPERVVAIPGAVDVARFAPRSGVQTLRERFGIPESAVVVGIVARIQRHRQYELLFEAVHRLMQEVPELYLLVLGRGTYAREIAHETVSRLQMEDRARLPGYVGGDDYPAALACFDVKVFLVPGSDGTCRAVREAMACGVPVIAARRGLLPEIVRDGREGLIIDVSVESLTDAIRRLVTDVGLRRELGAGALRRARQEFSLQRQAETVLSAYQRWLESTETSRPLRKGGGES
jgi:glycosyltransferase involved in cell wall biosynthesis